MENRKTLYMDWILYIVAFLFFLLGIGCLLLVVVGLPGGWIMLSLASVIEYCDQYYLTGENGTTETFGWWALGACLGLLLVGEMIEFLAGLAGAKKGGASRRGMIGSLIGGIIGVFVFAPLFSIFPLIGTIFGALLGALLGTFAGAMVGELSTQETTMKDSLKPAFGATVGRVVGTASKLGITIAIWLVLTVFAFWP
ncbi:MAG: DUF456 domain-containing protein [Planctomycetes bacterium]|nr:DUF456 domain-containing protein [Planctomycetota bacterium]